MNHLRINKILILILVMVMAFPIYTFSTDEKTLKVKVGWFPLDGFQEIDESGNFSGYNYEYLKKIEEYSNLEFEFVPGTWEDLMKALDSGDIDIMSNISKTNQREMKYLFSEYPMGESHITFVTRLTDKRITYGDFSALDGMTICYGTGDYRENQILELENKYNFRANKIVAGSGVEIQNKLTDGECDVAVLDSAGCYKGFRIIGEFYPNPFYYITSKDNMEIMNEIDDALSRIKMSNPIFESTLKDKYYECKNTIAYTEEEREYKRNLGVLKVGLAENEYVLSMYDYKTKEFTGANYQFMERISELSGMEFEYVPIPQNEDKIQGLINGDYDIVLGIEKSVENMNDKEILLTNTYSGSKLVMVGMNYSINTDNEIHVNYYNIDPSAVLTINKEYEKWKMNQDDDNDPFDELRRGDIDGVICNKYLADYHMQMHKNKELEFLDIYLNMEDSCMAVRSGDSKELVTIINKAMLRLSDNEMNKLIQINAAENKYELTFLDLVLNNIVLLLIGLILLIGLTALLLKFKNDKLRRLTMEAEEANKAKSEFLSRMSHDMRTPLVTVMGISDIAINEKRDIKDVEYFKQIISSSQYLLGLLNDILDMQRIESEQIVLDNEIFKLSEIFDKVLTITETKAKEKNINLELAKGNVSVDKCYFGDAKRIVQILINILNNALKYTPKNGDVYWSFRIDYKEGEILFVNIIKDNGVGMSKEFQKIMYEPFTREDNPESGSEYGTGLGLAIAGNLVKIMKGSITVKSSLGKGTQFTVKIPVGKINYDKEREYNCEERKKDSIDLSDKRILLCEDIKVNAKIIKKMLEFKGIKVEIAENGKKGLELAKKKAYDAILMDIKMPVMDGLEAAKEIRKFDKKIPIIALSANAYKEDVEASIMAGMNEHLSKPINEEILFKTLALFIKNNN